MGSLFHLNLFNIIKYIAVVFLTLISVLAWTERDAFPRPFYYEFQGGISQIRSGEGFFGAGTPAVLGYGTAAQLGLFTTITSESSKLPFEVQVGLQGLYTSVTSGTSYTILAPYPSIRFQLSFLYFGGGLCPVVWGTTQTHSSIQQISAIGALGEAGILWGITPEFTLGAVAGAQVFQISGGLSPKPALDFTLLMRFHIYLFGKAGASRKSIEWHGWRYPFGEIR